MKFIDRKNLNLEDVDMMIRAIMMVNDRIKEELEEIGDLSHDVEEDLDQIESILYANLIQK